jgi:FKBP-type peptidyl-prolyl cis-trans isomerase
MADSSRPSGLPIIAGGVILLVILCVGGYFIFGPGAQNMASSSSGAVNYPGDPVKGEPVKMPSGLMYYDIREGTGAQPSGPSTKVKVHYTGWLTNGTKFDSSVDRGEPIDFPLNRVIPGWTQGVGSMKVGGKRKLIIPAALGYGAEGSPPTIPGGATLVFDVELLGIVK